MHSSPFSVGLTCRVPLGLREEAVLFEIMRTDAVHVSVCVATSHLPNMSKAKEQRQRRDTGREKNRESNERETPNEAERTERSLIQKKNNKLGSLYLNYLEKRVNTTHLFNNRIG